MSLEYVGIVPVQSVVVVVSSLVHESIKRQITTKNEYLFNIMKQFWLTSTKKRIIFDFIALFFLEKSNYLQFGLIFAPLKRKSN